MSDNEFGKAVADIRKAIAEIREDVDSIEKMLVERAEHRWYHHIWLFRNKV